MTAAAQSSATRICSLLPGATEVIAQLGLADQLVGVSHECDFPPEVAQKTVMVEPTVDPSAPSASIDRDVREAVAHERPLYRLKEERLRAARPDLIITQQLCHVCAITPAEVERAILSLPTPPRLLALNPSTLADVLTDIVRIADAAGRPSEGRRLESRLRERLGAVTARMARLSSRRRVVCLEWLDPLYVGGHWIPEMVTTAGGQDVMGAAGAASRRVSWDDLVRAAPDVLIIMPCGFTIDRTLREVDILTEHAGWSDLPAVASDRMFLVEAGAYFSRPGPRLIDGVEMLAALIHADQTDDALPPGTRRLERKRSRDGSRSSR